jgi:signal transduction histidine kinase
MTGLVTSPDPAQRIEELGRIILAYSEVTERLQQSHEQLTQTVAALRAELSEKNRLLERKERLAALGEMAAGMAHEIRNPLGGIQLYASMLANDVAAMPPTLELVQKISGGVRRLEGLVSQVLQFTREIRASPAETDLGGIVETAIDLARPKIIEHGIDVSVRGDERPVVVLVDEQLLGQAVLNLVLNAVEAMEAGGRLDVQYSAARAQDGARQLRLVIRDGGPGIPASILDRIFNPFFTTKEAGTGLGLAIVHRVVDAHDGTITASNPPGGGAQFEIRI